MKNIFKLRLNKLLEKTEKNEGILVTDEKDCFYLSGISSSNITLYITKNEKYLITDSRYSEVAKKNKGGFSVLYKKNTFEYLKDIIKEETVFLQTERLSYDFVCNFEKNINVKIKKMGDKLASLRLFKDDYEIECIYKAQSIADRAFAYTLEMIKPGVTETMVKAELEYNMSKLGSQNPSFDTIVLFGKNTSLPHGEPSEQSKLLKNDIILMDFGATYNGYCSDTTRTFFIGSIDEEMKKTYTSVLNAHITARDNIKSGIDFSAADFFARDALKKDGLDSYFGHSLGHGVGLDIHEAPTLSPKKNGILRNNMTFSIEPGVYFEGKYGIRIEDLYYMKDGKPQSFTMLEKDMLIIK